MVAKLIGITGYKGSGKSEVSRRLQQSWRYDICPLAGPLKGMLLTLGIPRVNLYGEKKEEPLGLLGGKTGRYAMQTLGTEWGRELMGKNFWLDIWTAHVLKTLAAGCNVVTDDIRFINEAQRVQELGGKIWRVNRDGCLPSGHASEQELVSITPDVVINNDGTLLELSHQVEAYLKNS